MKYVLNESKIKELCHKSGLTNLGELCLKAKIHRNSITPYLKYGHSPFTQVVLDLANALNVPATELIEAQEDPTLVKVKQVLTQELKRLTDYEVAVFIFGSRARGTQQKFSDLDLGLTAGRKKIPFSDFAQVKSKIDDALDNLPISVNLINLDLAPPEFISEIEADLKFIIGNEVSASFFQGYLNGRKAS